MYSYILDVLLHCDDRNHWPVSICILLLPWRQRWLNSSLATSAGIALDKSWGRAPPARLMSRDSEASIRYLSLSLHAGWTPCLLSVSHAAGNTDRSLKTRNNHFSTASPVLVDAYGTNNTYKRILIILIISTSVKSTSPNPECIWQIVSVGSCTIKPLTLNRTVLQWHILTTCFKSHTVVQEDRLALLIEQVLPRHIPTDCVGG